MKKIGVFILAIFVAAMGSLLGFIPVLFIISIVVDIGTFDPVVLFKFSYAISFFLMLIFGYDDLKKELIK